MSLRLGLLIPPVPLTLRLSGFPYPLLYMPYTSVLGGATVIPEKYFQEKLANYRFLKKYDKKFWPNFRKMKGIHSGDFWGHS